MKNFVGTAVLLVKRKLIYYDGAFRFCRRYSRLLWL